MMQMRLAARRVGLWKTPSSTATAMSGLIQEG